MKLRSSEKEQEKLLETQSHILNEAKMYVAPRGRLVYATCSMLPSENERQLERFLKENSDFTPVPVARVWQELNLPPLPPQQSPYLRLSPSVHGTDGFFVGILQRNISFSK